MANSNWLHWGLVVGAVLLLFTPLIVSTSLFFPFITGKAFFFRLVVEIALALWLVLIWLKPEYRPQKSYLLIGVVSLVAITVLTTIFGPNPVRSFWSNFERMDGLVNYLHLLGYFLVLISVFEREKIWHWFWNASLGVSVIIGLYGLLQLVGQLEIHQGGARLDATLGNSAYLAVYALFHVFLALWLLMSNWQINWRRYLYGAIMVLNLVVLYYTATRGTILGLVGGGLLSLLLLAWREKKNLLSRNIATGILLAAIVLLGSFYLMRGSQFVTTSPVLSRFASISLSDKTTESRLTIWGMALEGFKERPVLGWGPENFSLVFGKYYEPKLWSQEPWFDRSHNIFLDWLITAGILGLLAYLSLFGAALYYLWRRRSNFTVIEGSILTGLLAAYFFNNIFVFDNLVSYIMFLAILAYIHFRVSPEMIPKVWPTKTTNHFWAQAGAVLIAGALLVMIYVVNLKPILASRTLIRALQSGVLDQKLSLFRQALAYETLGNNEIIEQLFSTALGALGSDLAVADKQKVVELALAEMSKQVRAVPGEIRPRLFYGVLLSRSGKTKEAIVQLEVARKLAPRKQQVLLELVRAYYLNNEPERALELSAFTYNLDRRYPDARKTYINMLAALKRYDLLPALWHEQVLSEPSNVDAWISWAAAEFAVGNKESAITILEETKAKFPEVAGDVDKLVIEIRAGRNPLAR